MDVSVGDTIPVILKDSNQRHHTPGVKKRPGRDRRRDPRDRKKGARDGVVVHLSGKTRGNRSAPPEKPKLTY